MKRSQWFALLGCSVAAISVSTPVMAQQSSQEPAPAASDKAPKSDAQSPENSNVSDIVVTANRREERLQDVPVTVTVVDGAQLTRQNVNTVEDLTRTAPALGSAGQPGSGVLSIRGIGAQSFARSSEGSVGVVFDGVSLANTSVVPPLVFDIERIEVLEGPQGMLFGRNASAGVINITTKAPDPTKIEGVFHGDVGSRDTYIARAAFNLPVSSNAALRVAGAFSQEPRVQKNLLDGTYQERKAKAVRGRFLWEPGDTVTFNLGADYTNVHVDGGAPWAVYSSTPGSLLTRRLTACGVTIDADNTEGCTNGLTNQRSETYGFSGQADVALGDLTLTSITAHRAFNGVSNSDLDSTSANRLNQAVLDRWRNFSQELRLAGKVGPVDFVSGLYYFDGKTRNRTGQLGQILADLPLIGACPLPAAALCSLPAGQFRRTNTETESYAAFGQVTINAGDKLRFILGGRVGHEDTEAATTAAAAETGAAFVFSPAAAVSARVKDTYFIYRAGAQYDVTSNLMVFGTYTRGYKGAAINDGAIRATDPLVVRPEIPKSGEVGFKATVLGGRAGFNATAFYTKVDDFQTQFYDSSIPAFIFGNAPSLTSKGFEALLFGRPVRGLTANVGVIYTDATFGDGYTAANALNVPVDASGNQLGVKWRITASTEYTTAVASDLDGFIQADVVYRTKGFSNAANDEILSINGGAIVGGRLGLRTRDQGIGVSVYVRNLFDNFIPTARFATPTAAQQLDRASYSQFSGPERHRSIGMSLDVKF